MLVSVWVLPDLIGDSPATSGGFTTTFRYTAGQERDAFEAIDGDLQDVWEASFKVVDAFTEWVQTSSFKQEVAQVTAENGLTIDNPAAIPIAPDNVRAVGQITISWGNPDELTIIAQAVITVLQTRNAAYFGPQLGDTPAQVILLDAPQIAPAPPPLTNRFGPLLRLALGIAVGIGLALLMEYFDPTLRERAELNQLGLNVLVTVPRGDQ